MKKTFFIAIITTFLLSLSCDKMEDINYDLDCALLQEGLLNRNQDVVKTEIDKLTHDLYPDPEENGIGHSTNMSFLVDRIKTCSNVFAKLHCYACIETLPAQSELLIRVDSANSEVFRTIDIITPEDDRLEFSRVH